MNELKQRTKILYVITQGAWGGAQRYVFDLATNLGANFDITIAVGEPGGAKDLQGKIEEFGISNLESRIVTDIKVIQLKHLVRPVSPLHDLLAVFELRNLYRTVKPDIIHLNSSKAGILGALASKLQIPNSKFVVYTVHGWVFNEPIMRPLRALYRWLEKITARSKDTIIVLSEADKRTGLAIGIPAKRWQVIPLGIAPAQHTYSREQAREILIERSRLPSSILQKQLWIGVVANFFLTKGLDILLGALAEQKTKLAETPCIIIGDGPERATLIQLRRELGLEDSVHFAGSIAEAHELMPAFDLVVIPSRKEGLPYVLLEAMSKNIPIVATRVGGIPEALEGHARSWLASPEDQHQLGHAIVTAIQEVNKNDVEPSPAAPSYKTRLSLEQMLSATSSLYASTERRRA